MFSRESSSGPKKHKKHKRDRYDRDSDRHDESKYSSSSGGPGNARLKLILKVGGSSTPEHSDSPGPAMSHVLNIPYDEDSRSSALSRNSYSQSKKKKKDKKRKKEKKHKHHHKEKKRREREELSVVPIPMEIDSAPEEGALEQKPLEAGETVGEGKEMTDAPSQPSTQPLIVPPELKTSILSKPRVLDRAALQKMLDHILRLLEKKDPQHFFAWPVTDKIAPGYSSIIAQPMDLSTMRSKVESGVYDTLTQFGDDFKLMCNNAMKYNHADTIYYKTAKKLLQSGTKILDPGKIRSLVPLLPAIRVLHEDQLGFPLFLEPEVTVEASQSEEELYQEPVNLDPTQSIHYVPPHPNDPPDVCGAFADDLTTEEVLHQARIAAREAAHKLSNKKPNSKMGFLRLRDDGSTSLTILTPTNGVLPGSREQPVSLGALTGKVPHGTSQLQVHREDKKNYARLAKPLNYGAFSSYAPSRDSTFAGLSQDEQELVQATYGDDQAVQYADSVIEFAKGCEYAMRMVDEVLDTLTKGEHSRTVDLVQERKKLDEEEALRRREQEAYEARVRDEWNFVQSLALTNVPVTDQDPIDYEGIKSLRELGIDTSFIEPLRNTLSVSDTKMSGKLEETAVMLGNLEKVQQSRLSQPTLPVHPYVLPPSQPEVDLADRIAENLIEMAKQTEPANLVSTSALHQAMGIDLQAFGYHHQPIVTQDVTAENGGSGPELLDPEQIPQDGDVMEVEITTQPAEPAQVPIPTQDPSPPTTVT